jgi:hypothetical protein
MHKVDETIEGNSAVKIVSAIYSGLAKIAQVAGALSLIFGIVWGAFQYYASKHDKQLEQTFTLFRQFNNGEYAVHREKIRTALQKHSHTLIQAAANESTLTAAIESLVASENISADLQAVLDFYDEIVYCVVIRNCDPKTTYSLFYTRAKETYINFYQYIMLKRKTSAIKDLGTGLETVAQINVGEK